ncbi:uncharacterized protein LOC141529231 isoform X3 [Cotesia typhae]|uniref:uncharacterized protein LOC141529231 isoform X3 n=1 Tax=Cotesia typhae TaxID=2053667 RepID=UPI003D699C5A
MKMLYEITGTLGIENSLKLSSTKSTDSTCNEKHQFFSLSAGEEENFHDVKSLQDIPKKADSDVYSVISEEKSLLSVNSFRVKSDEYFSASKQESHTHILTSREININMMQMLPQNNFNSKIYLNNQEFEASSEDSFNCSQRSEDSDQEERNENHPSVPVEIKCIKKPEPNFKFNAGRLEYPRRAKLKKKSNSSRISNRLNLLAKPKYEIKKFNETARIKMKKRKSKSIEPRSRNFEDEKPKFGKENTFVINPDQSGNEVQDNSSLSSNIIPAVENVEIIERLNENWSDVVEIYHNIQAKSISPSVVSSKQHFKLDIQQNIDYKDQNSQNNFQMETSITPEDFIRVDIQPHYNQNTFTRDQVFKHEECRSTQLHSWCCKSFSVRSYQRPTKASEAKKANRCFFTTRFDVRNIPFVVGTSITRSYNLGLNIQKVFGLMKNRHPETLNAIRPVLIRKVGETFGSTINAARSIYSDNEESIITSKQNFCHELIGQANNRVALKCNHYGDYIDTETVATHFTRSALLKQREEQLRESETFDSKCKRFTSNSGDVGKVLRRLQEQFEEMLEKYERLKDKIKKLNDLDYTKKFRL